MEILLGVRDIWPDAVARLFSSEIRNGVDHLTCPFLCHRPREHTRQQPINLDGRLLLQRLQRQPVEDDEPRACLERGPRAYHEVAARREPEVARIKSERRQRIVVEQPGEVSNFLQALAPQAKDASL